MHGHSHAHHHGSSTRAFAAITLITLAYTALEAGSGFATDSLSLLSAELQHSGDVLGLCLAWVAAFPSPPWPPQSPPPEIVSAPGRWQHATPCTATPTPTTTAPRRAHLPRSR